MSRLRFVLGFGLLVLSTTPVLAQTASDGDRAIAAGHAALDLYNKGSWAAARTRFEEADRLMHSPVFLLYAARCARNAEDLVGARALYERVARETLPATAPPPWANAVTSAKEELAALVKRMAGATPTATASATSSAPVPTASSTAPIPTASSTAPAPTASATSTTGGQAVPTGTAPIPSLLPTSSAAPRSSAVTGPFAPGGAPPQTGTLAPGLAALGVGLAGIGAGIGMFVHAKSIANGVLERCGDSPKCNEDDLPNRQSAYDFAGGATGAFLGGGLLAATGVALLIWRPFGRTAQPGQGLTVQPGPGALRVTGSF